MKKLSFRCLLVFVLPFHIQATSASLSLKIEQQADLHIKKLYQEMSVRDLNVLPNRIDWFSKKFLGKDYVLGALGEGSQARYDQFPKYRTDAFDCLTYVTTVLALSLSNSPENFAKCLTRIRYKNGKRSYINRNHFTSLDWNTNNQNQGLIEDHTTRIHDKDGKPIALIGSALINKSGWYEKKSIQSIRLSKKDPEKAESRLKALVAHGRKLDTKQADIPYLPLNQLFVNGKPNSYIFNQIPHGAIIEIVRPNWNLTSKIGTCLNVSHLGFAIRSGKHLYYREASSSKKKVIDIPLDTYLRNALSSPTIKGINIQVVKPQRLEDSTCSSDG